MKKIILSLFVVGVVSVVALVATSAFFNDTETSTGNVLQAGALDLKIDNTCYYNGDACTLNTGDGKYYFGGAPEGEPATNECSCTWESKDLGDSDVFFNLTDLKPGDWEEDTISVNVDNPSWLCANLTVSRDADNSCTEPEIADETTAQKVCSDPNGDGELDENLNFVFWKDDGDNVYECTDAEPKVCEEILTRGTADAVLNNIQWALADSSTSGGPIPAEDTFYIGKFFCFGDITDSPVVAGDQNNPTLASGFDCDGALVDNQSQTDSLEGDISFYAEQARHNDEFLCNQREVTALAE